MIKLINLLVLNKSNNSSDDKKAISTNKWLVMRELKRSDYVFIKLMLIYSGIMRNIYILANNELVTIRQVNPSVLTSTVS